MGQIDFNILQNAHILVAGDSISVNRRPNVLDTLDTLAADIAQFEDDIALLRGGDDLPPGDRPPDPVEVALGLYAAIQIALAQPRETQMLNMGGGKLHKALHKSLHKSLHKTVLTAGGAAAAPGPDAGAEGLMSWPVIEVPWYELGRLYDLKAHYNWDRLLDPPPAVEARLAEIAPVRALQDDLRLPENAWRRARIRIEASNDLTAYMLPLGADVTAPGSQTAVLFQTILWLGSLIGLQYKARFNAARPNVLAPDLEPSIPVPAYSSYPSNHAFQSFLIAEVFSGIMPEHPGNPALFRAAEAVAVNREWAGLHIRSDTEAGRRLARLCTPLFLRVLEVHIRPVRAEWLGEGGQS